MNGVLSVKVMTRRELHKESSCVVYYVPVIYFLVKADQNWQLVRCRYCHVILYCIQSSQNKVEYAHGISQCIGQLLSHNGKAVGKTDAKAAITAGDSTIQQNRPDM